MAEQHASPAPPDLPGFCRARVLGFDQLGTEIFDECGGSAVPQITPIGRQMILGHLLRAHASELNFLRALKDRRASPPSSIARSTNSNAREKPSPI